MDQVLEFIGISVKSHAVVGATNSLKQWTDILRVDYNKSNSKESGISTMTSSSLSNDKLCDTAHRSQTLDVNEYVDREGRGVIDSVMGEDAEHSMRDSVERAPETKTDDKTT